ncbi:MAG: hypothetical protein CL862_00505 [Cyanobium sp. NAT70]|nr:hypothetical protein [Cyanobium sp. NAT70]|tara:strand:+ start:104 stop:304 length:201 start_codon:yes stop_codon:yes gene_type:complete
MFNIEKLSDQGWALEGSHESQDSAFTHARAKSDTSGQTYRVINTERSVVCVLTHAGSHCWQESVAS